MRMEKEEEIATNYFTNALTKPIVLISAWREWPITSPQTVTFDSFLVNYNNADESGGGDGDFDLDSGIFTCLTPGYYTVSFSAYAEGLTSDFGANSGTDYMYLSRNGGVLPESKWISWVNSTVNADIGFTGSRILVSSLL